MNKEFVTYEQALGLKELGFDEPCLKTMLDFDITYESDIKMPLFQQAFRWFREKHELVVLVKFGTNEFTFNIYKSDGIGLLTKESLAFNGSYEEAETACLNKLIEIVKGDTN